MTTDSITEFAPAKVNLSLRVGQAREDGYHPLDSLVTFADWGDSITVREEVALMMSMSGPAAEDLVEEENNLVLRAARLLQDKAGLDRGAVIHLNKEIPIASGLGGGSADAAATLRALNQLWDLGMDLDELATLALDLGADVPACVYSRPLRMRGIGEWIELLPRFPAFSAALVNPGVAVSTADVFARFDRGEPGPLIEAKPVTQDTLDWLAREPNHLEAPARQIEKSIGKTLKWLKEQRGVELARMSGSGASCFAIFENGELAEIAADAYDGFGIEVGLAGFDHGELVWTE